MAVCGPGEKVSWRTHEAGVKRACPAESAIRMVFALKESAAHPGVEPRGFSG